MRWAILYRDGSVFTSADGGPFDAPRTEVQMIFQEDKRVDVTTVRSPWGFWKWEGAWVGVDREGQWQHMVGWPQPLILFGSFLTQPDWAEMQQVIERTLGICKQSWYAHEREIESVLS